MRFGDSIQFHRMGEGDDSLRCWFDVRLGRFWYVLIWRKGFRPYCYRSIDATPPDSLNEGRWLFGRRVGVRSV